MICVCPTLILPSRTKRTGRLTLFSLAKSSSLGENRQRIWELKKGQYVGPKTALEHEVRQEVLQKAPRSTETESKSVPLRNWGCKDQPELAGRAFAEVAYPASPTSRTYPEHTVGTLNFRV